MSQSTTTATTGAAAKTTPKAVKAPKAASETLSVEPFTKAAQDQLETMMAAFTENTDTVRAQTEDMVKTVQENFETASERLQSVNGDLMNAAREEMSDAMNFANDLARAKTIGDAMEIQRDYWTNLFETRMERARDLTETSVKTTQEMFEPMNDTLADNFKPETFEKFFPFAKAFATK